MKDVQQVDYIATDEVLKNNNKEFLNEKLINKVKNNNYDLIFFYF